MLTNTKPGLVLLLLLVFSVNLAETAWETSRHTDSPVSAADYKGAYAVRQFEPEFINFEFHDQTARWAMYAYSVSYFVLFPVVAFGVLIALARRAELAPFRVLCLAVTADYCHEPAVVPAVPGAGALGVPGLERHPAVGSMVLGADRLDPAAERDQQLVPEHPRVAHRDRHLRVLAVSRPPAQHGDGAGDDRHPRHVRARHSLARRHHCGRRGGDAQRGRGLAVDRYVRAAGAGAGIGPPGPQAIADGASAAKPAACGSER